MLKRRISCQLLVGLFTVALAFAHTPAYAGGLPQNPIEVSVSSSTQAANGTSKITFTLLAYAYYCSSDGYLHETSTCFDGSTSTDRRGQPDQIGIYPSGGGNLLGGTTDEGGGVYSVQADSSGHAQFTLASTVAETKIFKFTDFARTQPYANAASASVTFTAVAKAPTPPKSAAPPAPAPAPAPPPDTPKITTLEVAGQPVTNTTNLTLNDKQPLTLQGTTVPNGVVKLYIFSTPREALVTADANGNWSYVVQNLAPGSHHVEAEVTDPATGKTSARATLAAFTIKAPSASVVATKVATKKSAAPLWAGLGAAVIIIVGLGVWLVLRRNKQRAQQAITPAAQIVLANQTDSASTTEKDQKDKN